MRKPSKKIFRRKLTKTRKSKSKGKSLRKKMRGSGPSQSKPTKEQQEMMNREVENAQARALQNFNLRVRSWSFPHHGPYAPYIQWCQEQYQLECIPESWRQGSTDANANREFEENMREHRQYGE